MTNQDMQLFSFKEHFLDLKSRIIKILASFMCFFVISYYFKLEIAQILLEPLANLTTTEFPKRIIYTKLTEAFFSYIKLSAFSAFCFSIPIISYQVYLFIKPGLYHNERRLAVIILASGTCLFWLGALFVFYFVMPKAWDFFLSFESHDTLMPLILEARISEYLSLVMQLIIAFGLAFQLPVVLLLLNLMQIVTVQTLQKKRKVAIVINFIIAGIITPPDIISQLALAVPMLLLYELSIFICKLIERQK